MQYTFRFLKQTLVLVAVALFLMPALSLAQTKGLVVKTATAVSATVGRQVLDPDLDGYVSKKTNGIQLGFQNNDTLESEIPYKPLTVPGKEPMEDLVRGPKQGFSDFADVPGAKVYPVSSYLSPAGNFMFRFRLGGIAPNSKGYSILVDADQKFGFSGATADPEASTDNPGFEFEIVLATNFDVRLYDVNNNTGTATLITATNEFPYAVYAQKAVAFFENAGTDYFYDFYIPFSKITTYFNGSTAARPLVNTSTPLRMAANTVMAPQSAIKGPISDISGVDAAAALNPAAAWLKIVDGFVATPAAGTTTSYYPPVRSATPVITSSSFTAGTGKTITGTSSEAAGTVIKIYANGVYMGQTTVQTGGTWIYPASGTTSLTTNQRITATSTATGKSESLVSNEVIVGTNCTYSRTPELLCASDKGFSGRITGAAANTIINLYRIGDPNTVVITVRTGANGMAADEFKYLCSGSYNNTSATNCNPGGGCIGTALGNGSYYARAIETVNNVTLCESPRSASMCVGLNSTSFNPGLTTDPITQSTTTLTGTGIAGSRIVVLADNLLLGSFDIPAGTTSWTISNITVKTGQTVQVQQIEAGKCASPFVTRPVTNPSTAPVVNSPIRTNTTTITGTSVEAAGTIIKVSLTAGTTTTELAGTATVLADGTWSFTKPAGVTFAAGNTITATATASGETISSVSNSVTVTAAPAATPAVPNVTLIGGVSYKEGGTTVNVTVPANTPSGTNINLYIDGYLLKTITTTTTSTTATVVQVTGLSAANYDLYTGGYLSASLGTIGVNESAQSNQTAGTYVIVECVPPVQKNSSVVQSQICQGSQGAFNILNSAEGTVYTLQNNGVNRGPSVLGTGGTVTAYTFALSPSTPAESFTIQAMNVSGGSCSPTTFAAGLQTPNPAGTATITVNPAPETAKTVTAPSEVFTGETATVVVQNSQSGYLYQLREGATLIGSVVQGTGGNISLQTDAINTTRTFNVLVTDVTRSTNCTSQLNQTVTISNKTFDGNNDPLPVSLISFTARKQNQLVVLNWATASEKDNERFQVERSANGKNFEAIGSVKGNGTTNVKKQYAFTDNSPLNGVSYYRLKQIDFNGEFEYSPVVAVTSEKSAAEAAVYPNPFHSKVSVSVSVARAEMVNVTVFDTNGRKLATTSVQAEKGNTVVPMNLENLPSGIYLIHIESNNQVEVKRISKIK